MRNARLQALWRGGRPPVVGCILAMICRSEHHPLSSRIRPRLHDWPTSLTAGMDTGCKAPSVFKLADARSRRNWTNQIRLTEDRHRPWLGRASRHKGTETTQRWTFPSEHPKVLAKTTAEGSPEMAPPFRMGRRRIRQARHTRCLASGAGTFQCRASEVCLSPLVKRAIRTESKPASQGDEKTL